MGEDVEPQNRLLRRLNKSELSTFMRAAELVHLDIRDDLVLRNTPIESINFPEVGVISIVSQMDDGSQIEVATVGTEGYVGTAVMLGVDHMPEAAYCQVEGTVWRLQTSEFLRLVHEIPVLDKLCKRYVATLLNQVALNISCNWTHTIDARCARWLLMTHDRVIGDQFYLTQEFLSMMLGVTRSGVNAAAAELQKVGLITYVRGRISILNREGLENASCSCYKVTRKYWQQTFEGLPDLHSAERLN